MNTQQIIVNNSLKHKKKIQEIIEYHDLDYILGMQKNGLNFLLEIYQYLAKLEKGLVPSLEESILSYQKIKRYLSTYLQIYLTSGSFYKKNAYKNLEAFKNIWTDNLSLIEDYLVNVPSQFRKTVIERVLSIVFNETEQDSNSVPLIKLNETLSGLNILIKNTVFKEFLINELWDKDTGKEMQSSFLGKIISKYINHKSNADKENTVAVMSSYSLNTEFKSFLALILKNYKKPFKNWYTKLIESNSDYSKMAVIVNLTESSHLSDLNFLVNSLEILLFLYHDARINYFKSTDNIQQELFNTKKTKKWWSKNSDDTEIFSDKKPGFFESLFIYINKLLEHSIIPIIEKIRQNDKQVQQIHDLITIEQNSIRWGSTGFSSTLKQAYIDRLKKREKALNDKSDEYVDIIKFPNLSKLLLFFLNDLSKIVIEERVSNIPKKFLENIFTIIDFNKNIMKTYIIGDNCNNIIALCIKMLSKSSYKTHIRIKSLNFISVNNHIISDILIRYDNTNKYFNMKEYITCLLTFYLNINKGEESDYYNKMLVRYKINSILLKFISLYLHIDSNSYSNIEYNNSWKNILSQVFTEYEIIQDVLYHVINDSLSYFEEIITAIKKIEDLKKATNYNSILGNEERIYRQSITVSTYSIYMDAGMELLTKLINITDKNMSNINLTKLITSLNFYLYSILDKKHKYVYDFNFTKYNIKYNWLNMLKQINEILLIKHNCQDFVETLCQNRDWYDKLFIQKLSSLVQNKWEDSNKLPELISSIEKISKEMTQKNKDQVEYPDEFCDPLLMTPIKEPVLLPESKIFIDRDTIISHLLNDETDPFNRTKLTKEILENFNQLPETTKLIKEFKEKLSNWEKINISNSQEEILIKETIEVLDKTAEVVNKTNENDQYKEPDTNQKENNSSDSDHLYSSDDSSIDSETVLKI